MATNHIGKNSALGVELPQRIREMLQSNVKEVCDLTISWKQMNLSDLPEEEFLQQTNNPERGFFRPRHNTVTYQKAALSDCQSSVTPSGPQPA